MPINIIYTNNNIPSNGGDTLGITAAGLQNKSAYFVTVPSAIVNAPSNNPYAAATIQSNGDNIGNATLPYNPLPPGLTS
jgi:hypothetical protein